VPRRRPVGRRSSLRLLRLLQHEDVIADARAEAAALVEQDLLLDGHPALRQAVVDLLDAERGRLPGEGLRRVGQRPKRQEQQDHGDDECGDGDGPGVHVRSSRGSGMISGVRSATRSRRSTLTARSFTRRVTLGTTPSSAERHRPGTMCR
jgi:hypothetical protein